MLALPEPSQLYSHYDGLYTIGKLGVGTLFKLIDRFKKTGILERQGEIIYVPHQIIERDSVSDRS
jgi:hypothetical protein